MLTPISIHKNVETEIKYYSTSVFGSDKQNHLAIIQGMRKQPLFVHLAGRLDKITVVFRPLGLNHFVKNSFSAICPQDSQLFTEWDQLEDYQAFLRGFYTIDHQSKRIRLFEKFLLSLYRPIESEDLIEKAISLLTNFEDEKTVERISQEIGLNIRTFNRIFKENAGISPVGFRKIARFRHSINEKFFNEQFERLTDIAYNSNFYDQSYFINIYQQLTGSNPKYFFDEVEKVGADTLFFRFLGK